jgi:hypothetical protein
MRLVVTSTILVYGFDMYGLQNKGVYNLYLYTLTLESG